MDIHSILLALHLLAMAAMLGATMVNGVLHLRARQSPPVGAAPLLAAIMAVNRAIMAPSLVLLPASGLWLALDTGYALSDIWILLGIGLAVALILAFAVGLVGERRLEGLADRAAMTGQTRLPETYARVFQRTAPIGGAAALFSLAAVIVMVTKPI